MKCRLFCDKLGIKSQMTHYLLSDKPNIESEMKHHLVWHQPRWNQRWNSEPQSDDMPISCQVSITWHTSMQ